MSILEAAFADRLVLGLETNRGARAWQASPADRIAGLASGLELAAFGRPANPGIRLTVCRGTRARTSTTGAKARRTATCAIPPRAFYCSPTAGRSILEARTRDGEFCGPRARSWNVRGFGSPGGRRPRRTKCHDSLPSDRCGGLTALSKRCYRTKRPSRRTPRRFAQSDATEANAPRPAFP